MTGDWTTVRIGDWGEVKGGRQRSPHLTAGRMRPYLRVANVFDGFIDTSDVLQMPFTDDEFAQYAVQPGDILLNEGQSIELVGRSAIYHGAPAAYAFQNTLVRFRPGSNCDSLYAHEVFRQLWREGVFQSIAKKTTSIAHLGVTRFANLRVRVPHLQSQKRIAQVLRRFNSCLATVVQLLEAKRAFKRALMQELLTGRRRFAGYTVRIPRVALGDHVTELSQRSGAGWEPNRVMGVIKGVGLAPMRDHVRAADLSRYKVLPPDGFAYNPMRLNIGSIARSHLPDECLVSPDYVVFRANSETLLPSYLDQLRHSLIWSQFMRPAGSGSVRVRIYFRDLSEMQIPLPSLDEQHRIAQVLECLDQEILLLQQLHAARERQKSALMQRLLTGELTAPIAEGNELEPAHA